MTIFGLLLATAMSIYAGYLIHDLPPKAFGAVVLGQLSVGIAILALAMGYFR